VGDGRGSGEETRREPSDKLRELEADGRGAEEGGEGETMVDTAELKAWRRDGRGRDA
jgi:hypothetical protein